MDLHEMKDDQGGFWTNEKHVNYLNWMETSFVRTMLQNNARFNLTYATGCRAPLDRYLPDSSDSTRDLKQQRNRRKNTQLYFSEIMNPKIKNAVRTSEKRTRRRRSLRPFDASQDQVVPQLGNRNGNKDDDESVELEVVVGSTN